MLEDYSQWYNEIVQGARKEFKGNLYFKCEKVNVMMTHIGGYPRNLKEKI